MTWLLDMLRALGVGPTFLSEVVLDFFMRPPPAAAAALPAAT